MIRTVDENGDGKINYQEFRVMIGAKPNLRAARDAQKAAEAKSKPSSTTTTSTTMTTTTGGLNSLATTVTNSTMPQTAAVVKK